MGCDSKQLKKEFPILQRRIHGKPFTFLDSAASSQKPRAVLEAMQKIYEQSYANIHRGVYTVAEEATAAFEESREKIRQLINASSLDEVIFTGGTTAGINLVARSFGDTHVGAGSTGGAGNEILLTEMEHHANLVPWQLLAQRVQAKLKFIPFDGQGRLELGKLDTLLTDRTKIVAVTMASNTLGTLPPVKTIIEKAHAKNIPVLLDAAQAAPHMKIDVRDLDCDFLAFSGHKMCGPTGIGVLFGKKKHLEAMPPFLGGGEMIKTVTWEHSTWNDLPWKFEAGTMPIVEAVGLGAAVDFLETIGFDAIHEHEQTLVRYAMERMHEIPRLQIYGPPAQERGGLVSFTLDNIHPHDLAAFLDQHGIAVRAGHHCTQPLHQKLGVAATTRASFYIYNDKEDVDRLIEALKKAGDLF